MDSREVVVSVEVTRLKPRLLILSRERTSQNPIRSSSPFFVMCSRNLQVKAVRRRKSVRNAEKNPSVTSQDLMVSSAMGAVSSSIMKTGQLDIQTSGPHHPTYRRGSMSLARTVREREFQRSLETIGSARRIVCRCGTFQGDRKEKVRMWMTRREIMIGSPFSVESIC